MASGSIFPAFLKLEYQRDDNARSQFLSDVRSLTDQAERQFSKFSAEAGRQLDAALAVKRNASGSLDVGASAARARAVAAREIAVATELAARAESDYTSKARLAVAASQALAREEEDAARAALNHAAALEQVQAKLNLSASMTQLVTGRSRGLGIANDNVAQSSGKWARRARWLRSSLPTLRFKSLAASGRRPLCRNNYHNSLSHFRASPAARTRRTPA